jgi:hypothetical protein
MQAAASMYMASRMRRHGCGKTKEMKDEIYRYDMVWLV